MSIWTVLIDIVILLGAGALFGALFERLRQSAILGYLLAGILLGPNALHVVRSSDEVLAVSELGVALLLFVIGLEFSWARLRSMGRVALGSGGFQVLATAALGYGVARWAGLGIGTALALGAICALSSTACVMRVLAARGEVETAHGARSLGILLMQDMAVVPFVLVVSVLAEGGTTQEALIGILRTAGIGLGLIVALYIVFQRVVPWLLSGVSTQANRELPLLIAVASGLGSGVASHAAGLSPALGAFVAGMLLAESPFALQVRSEVVSLKTLFLTLFFTAIGMLADPGWIAANALLVGGTVLGVVAVKASIVWLALRLFDRHLRTGIATGVCLAQTGEFSFVLADIGRGSLLDEELFLLVVSTTVLTMVLTPFLVGSAAGLARRFRSRAADPLSTAGSGPDAAALAIVVGYGPAGRRVAERIAARGAHVVVVDQNPASALEARQLGFGGITGDARYAEVMEHAGLVRAAFVVLMVQERAAALHIVRFVRRHAPEARVLVRARFESSVEELRSAGAHVVIDEEGAVGDLAAEAFEREHGGADEAAD